VRQSGFLLAQFVEGTEPLAGFSTGGQPAMIIALYEPDIPQNTGTILRLGACLGIAVHIVGPAAFPANEKAFRRAGLDYLDHVSVVNHVSFGTFEDWRKQEGRRIVLLSTKASNAHIDLAYRDSDVLLCGRESAGVPEEVHQAADERVRVPMRQDLRSLNVAVSLAMVLGEALRQTGGFPRD
jgi:tRNA (cytidine/uridine-2'-O-)-methyltransferase